MYIADAKKPNAPEEPKKPAKKMDFPFQKSTRIQLSYERSLKGIAREVKRLIYSYSPTDMASVERLKRALVAYAELIEPWARKVTERLLKETIYRNLRTWKQHTREMSEALRKEIGQTSVGDRVKDLMEQNVTLIKSIPLEAAQKVHEKVINNLTQGKRYTEFVEDIQSVGGITLSRATLIARTESGRASSTLVQAQAEDIGSEGYIWRTSGDLIVRKSHKEMNGKFVKWTEPPTLDKMIGHAGCLPNCRCWPEPVVPDID